jgi:putative transposase
LVFFKLFWTYGAILAVFADLPRTASLMSEITNGEHQMVQRSVVFALDPTGSQGRALVSHAGAARFTYNLLLAEVKANLSQREAEKTYGLDGDQLTPIVPWSKFSLQKLWNARKDEWAPWSAENGSRAYRTGANNLGRALANFSTSRSGKRAGAKVGFPRMKKRSAAKLSINFENGARLSTDSSGVVVSRIGRIHLLGDVTGLRRDLAAGDKINSTTISYRRGRWQASFQVLAPVPVKHRHRATTTRREPIVGVDVGVKDTVVAAAPDGREVMRIPAPRYLKAAATAMARLQRKAARQVGPYDAATRRRQTPSAGWRKTQADISRLHARTADLRANHLHHITAALAARFEIVVIEDLNIRGMLSKPAPRPDGAGGHERNGRAAKRGLSRSIADASLGELHRQLDYKTSWAGGTVVQADRFFPSSKTCSYCGVVKAKLLLSERVFSCDDCGRSLDRDLNAAINLARYFAGHPHAVSGSGSGLVSGRGAHSRPSGQHRPNDTATPSETRGLLHRKAQTVSSTRQKSQVA